MEKKYRYFTIKELENSQTAKARGIDNSIPANLLPNADKLITELLDPIREKWGQATLQIKLELRIKKLTKNCTTL